MYISWNKRTHAHGKVLPTSKEMLINGNGKNNFQKVEFRQPTDTDSTVSFEVCYYQGWQLYINTQ